MAEANTPEANTLEDDIPPVDTNSDQDSTDLASPPPDPLSLSQRRASAQLLSPLLLTRTDGIDGFNVITSEELEQVQVTGVTAYAAFLEQRLENEGDIPQDELQDVINQVESRTRSVTASVAERNQSPEPTNTSISKWREKGQLLNALAVAYENSEERKKLRREAQRFVDHEDEVTKQGMIELMDGFFESGPMSAQRILTLFTFISDVIIFSIRRKSTKLFALALDWAIEYILDKVSAWVRDNGGWDALIRQPWTYLSAAAQIALAGICLYISYRLVKSAIGSLKK